MREATVYAPASIGNIGPGFDVLGVAVSNLGDLVTATRKREPGVEIISIENECRELAAEPEKNTSSLAAMKVIERIGAKEGLNLRIRKGVPFPSGLGSSAAGAVAGGLAANLVFDEALSQEELLEACTEAEAKVSKAYFSDNTAAALYGGGVLTRVLAGNKIETVKLGNIPKAVIILATPDFPMFTKKSREVLPKEVPIGDFVWNMGAAAQIVAAFLKKDVALLGRAIEDRIVEPARKALIPGFDEVKRIALEKGALGCSISGGGPSVFAVADSRAPADEIGYAMKRAFKNHDVNARIHICSIETKGARMVT